MQISERLVKFMFICADELGVLLPIDEEDEGGDALDAVELGGVSALIGLNCHKHDLFILVGSRSSFKLGFESHARPASG